MRLVAEESRDEYGKMESMELRLYCKNEAEFDAAWQKIKDIDDVVWSGCPAVEDDGRYSDLVAVVKKQRGMTVADVKESISEIRKDINEALKAAH